MKPRKAPTTAADSSAAPPRATRGRRGRPSRVEEGAITQAIIMAALQLFLADGYGATSMKRIGEEAQVAPNTLYARFPEKASLFSAIIEWKVATWRTEYPYRRAKQGATLTQIIETTVLGMFEGTQREDISAIGRLLAQEAERFPELAEIYYANAMAYNEKDIVEQLQCASDVRLSDQDAGEIATTLTEAVMGHSSGRMFRRAAARSDSPEQFASRIARVLSRGSMQTPSSD